MRRTPVLAAWPMIIFDFLVARLIPCVRVRLGPEGTTILTPVIIEVVERPTPRYTVTIPVEKLEGWCTLSRGFISNLHQINQLRSLPSFQNLKNVS
ncbi:hypothetical protein YC2023_077585 [Brassica napus]